MKQVRTTYILLALLIAFSALALWSFASLRRSVDDAQDSVEDLQIVQGDAADLQQARAAAPAAVNSTDLSGQVQRAAAEAQVGERLQSVEPVQRTGSNVAAAASSGVLLRFNAISLRQLVAFLQTAAEHNTLLSDEITLTPPAPGAPAMPAETWAVELILSARGQQ